MSKKKTVYKKCTSDEREPLQTATSKENRLKRKRRKK